MESSPQGNRAGDIASHLFIIFVTVVNLVFFTSFHEYISWPTTEPDGSVTRLSMIADDYSRWLPFPIIASIIAIVAYTLMIFVDRDWFQLAAQIPVNLIGIAVAVSTILIFPFDFSVIPNATAVRVVPIAFKSILGLLATIYAISSVALFAKLRGQADG